MTHTVASTRMPLRNIRRLLLLTTAILLSIPTSAKTASTEKQGVEKGGITLEQFQKISMLPGSRKIGINPIQPAAGIMTGGVMAYGHFIPPPYKVEYLDDRLLINGVQVSPSLVKERHRSANPVKPLTQEKQAISDKVGRLLRDAREIYTRGNWITSASVRQQRVLDMLGKHPNVIQNPRWQSEVLCYSTPVYDGTTCENFGPSMFSSPKVQARNVAKNRTEGISEIERLLKEGVWVCFGSALGHTRTKRDPRAVVNEVMKDPSLGREQKIELLHDRAFQDYDLALDVVDNYSAREWDAIK